MTVIEFGRKDVRVNVLYIILGALAVCSVFFSIVSYSRVSSLRHDAQTLQKDIAREQVQSAELKTALMEKLEEFDGGSYLSQRGYVLDKNPAYSQVTEDESR